MNKKIKSNQRHFHPGMSWTCIKCGNKFTPVSGSVICANCRPDGCSECGCSLAGYRSDKIVCNSCKPLATAKRARDWYRKNKERKLKYDAAYRKRTRERRREVAHNFLKRHPERVNANTQLRRAKIKKRLPLWADKEKIQQIYEMCPKGMEVDHIIPLKGDIVSGLHVHTNLQYLSRSENRRKSNHYSLEYGGMR